MVCTRIFSPQSLTTIASNLFIASIATNIPFITQRISFYTVFKAAVRGLVKPLAMKLEHGIRVNSLSPGYMTTDMTRELQAQQPDLLRQFEGEGMFGWREWPLFYFDGLWANFRYIWVFGGAQRGAAVCVCVCWRVGDGAGSFGWMGGRARGSILLCWEIKTREMARKVARWEMNGRRGSVWRKRGED